ncbi:MAG TPA: pyruvate carboxylase subunit B [Candidatus Cloacimonadota bacterium]|nr:pyruvate carboxylase subunit B [Candidatus Cloacimonadota bacterium]HPT71206.1 pyruvate carboxylase subunit B [Candidatus Cloacimonadota bacterium]
MDNHGVLQMTQMQYATDRRRAENPVKVQDLTFRDGHQSLFATRGRTEDMLVVAEQMDKVGFYSMEVWGGATFDTMTRYLNEDPWERIRVLKKHIRNTPFSMLLRGQNLVGYRNYADDVVETFVQRACDNGIDIFRVFDALNDFRNFETAVKIIQKNKKHFQGAICYSLTEMRMGGEIYTIDYYVKKAKELEKMGADTIAIKDMAGIISPYDAYNLIKALKEAVKVPIHLHTHFTSGMGDLALLKAVEAGVDIIDTCMAPYAYRTSHAAIEPLVVTLLGTNRDTGMDIKLLDAIDKELEKAIPKYMHYADNTKYSIIDTNVIIHQTPGGMLSNLVNQLRQMDALDRLDEVFETLPKVRKDLGMIPLVTPTSQIVGIQTVNNVLFDKKPGEYSHITEQVKDLCYGLYGETTRPINSEVRAKALKDYPRGQKPITKRPGDVLEPEMPGIKEQAKGLAKDIDDELIVALYPVTGPKFLKWKYGLEEVPADVKPLSIEEVEKKNALIEKALAGKLVECPDKEAPEKPENIRTFDVFVDGEYFKVEVNEKGVPAIARPAAAKPVSQPKPAAPAPVKADPVPAKASKNEVAAADGDQVIHAPMPGMIISYEKKVGDTVKYGETVLVLEAMKMYNNIACPCDGVVKAIPFGKGDSVGKGDTLLVVSPK